MAETAGVAGAASYGNAAGGRFARAAGGAIITGLIAFLLFVAIVGMKTEAAQGGVMIVYRWQLAIGLSAGAALVRLLLDLFVWSRPADRRTDQAKAAANYRVALIGLSPLYTLGGRFFFVPDTRLNLASGVGDFFGSPHVRIAVELLGLLLVGMFVIFTAMLAMLAVRRALALVPVPGHSAPIAAAEPVDFATEFRRQFPAAMLLIAVLLPILVAGPQQRYALDTAIQVVTYVMLGWGLNVVVGLAGLLDLGYVAFYAVGAYSYALISTEFGWSFWVCLPLAGFFAAMWGIILGFPVLRLRGDYLAIVTLAFGEMIRIVLTNWTSLTGGPNGISRIPKLSFFGISFNPGEAVNFHGVFGLEYDAIYRIVFMYYVILVLALMVNWVSTRLRRLPLGRAWEALREDEIACRSLGINTVTTKLTAFAMGAMFGGFAGSFFASRQGFISPESFTFQESALVLAVVVLGGLGSQIGVALAAIVLVGSSEFFRDLEDYRMLIFGASMVVIMVWRPRGIIGSRTPSVVLKEAKAISGTLVKEGAG